jgi:hypothetical protein
VKIHMQHLAARADGAGFPAPARGAWRGVVFDGQIHEQVFRGGVVHQVGDSFALHFEVLRLGLAAVNGRGHAAGARSFVTSPRALANADTLSMLLISFSKN